MASRPLIQCLIFVVDNQSPSASSSPLSVSPDDAAFALMPNTLIREHPGVLRFFQQKNITILSTETVLTLLPKLDELSALEIFLDGNPAAPPDPLFVATSVSCQSAIQQLLGIIPEQVKDNEYRTIHTAIDEGSLKVIEPILSRRPDVPCKFCDSEGNLLHMAARTGQLAFVNLLLESGADIDSKISVLADTPLHQAVIGGCAPVIEQLIERGADVNAKDGVLRAPLHYARELNVAQVLLENGADANHTLIQCLIFVVDNQSPSASSSPLSFSSDDATFALMPNTLIREHPGVIRFFQQKNITILSTETVLTLLPKLDKLSALEIFLDGNPAAPLDPLFVATSVSCQSAIQQLLGIIPEQVKDDEYRTIHTAIDEGSLKVIEPILSRRPDVPCKFCDSEGNLLHMAARTGQLAFVNLLLESGADIHSKISSLADTPLHQAVIGGCAPVIEQLIERGADVNAKDGELRAPLHYARELNVAQVLLENGADANGLDGEGKSALLLYLQSIDYTNRDFYSFHKAALELFLKYGARVDGEYENNPILKFVLERIGVPVLDFLLENCFVDPSILQDTALHDAASCIPEDLLRDKINFLHELCVEASITFAAFSRHLVKVVTLLQIPDPENVVESFWQDETRDLLKFRNACEKEVASLKSLKISETSISLFDILTSQEQKIACLLRNESIAQGIGSLSLIEQFPEYGKILHYHLERGKNWKLFQEEGCKSFDTVSSNFKALPDGIKEKVMNFLSPADIMNLKRAPVTSASTQNRKFNLGLI